MTVDRSQPDQERVGGILLKNLVGQKDPQPDTDDKPWYVQLQDLQLQDSTLVYKDQALQSVIAVQTLSLSHLETDPQADAARISFKGTIDDAPVALEGGLNLFSSKPGFEGRLSVDRLAIQPYLALLGEEMQQNKAVVSRVEFRLRAVPEKVPGVRGRIGFAERAGQPVREGGRAGFEHRARPAPAAYPCPDRGGAQGPGRDPGCGPGGGAFHAQGQEPGHRAECPGTGGLRQSVGRPGRHHQASARKRLADRCQDLSCGRAVPLWHAPGDGPAYLEKIAGVLTEKPEIHVKVCGVATSGDRGQLVARMKQAFLEEQKQREPTAKQEAATELPVFEPDQALLETQLKELAVQRADAVSRYLIDQQNTEPKRLIGCQPKTELEASEAKPRAELLL